MVTLRLIWHLIAANLCCGAIAVAATPEECARHYLRTVNESGLTAALVLVHPDDLRELRKLGEKFRARWGSAPELKALPGFEALADEHVDWTKLSDLDWCQRFMPGFEKMQAPILDLKKEFAKHEVLGSVADGEFRYVIVRWRMDMFGTEIVKLNVMPIKMHNGEPMVLLAEEIMQGAKLLAAQL